MNAAPNTTPSIRNVCRQLTTPSNMVTNGDSSTAPMPKPMSSEPEANPCLSGYQRSAIDITVLLQKPVESPTNTP